MRKILRKLLPITFTLAVATAVTFSTPVFVERAYAAPMEDCDLDGYDDHTGKPVPWNVAFLICVCKSTNFSSFSQIFRQLFSVFP